MHRSDKVTFVKDAYCKEVYLIRVQKLVDESGYCICDIPETMMNCTSVIILMRIPM